MENLGLTHNLSDEREQNLDGLLQEWGADLLEDWPRRYGDEVLQGAGKVTQMWRTAMITVCAVRQAKAAAHEAQLENAIYGNRSPNISDEELADYIERRHKVA